MEYVLPMFSLDHLVYATPDLAATTAWFAERSGVVPAAGGQHVGRGTRNTLVGLGGSSYLEIIGPDLDQAEPDTPRPFGVDELERPTLVTWAVGGSDLAGHVARCRAAGIDLGEPTAMSRAKPDGSLLEWILTVSDGPAGPIPFLIDWRGAPTPAASLDHPVALASLAAQSPDAAALRRAFDVVGIDVPVEVGERERLVAVVETPNGRVELDG